MRLKAPLDATFATQGHVRVLRALDALPEGLAVSVRDIARRSGMGHPRASQVLADLNAQGLTIRAHAGRADLYKMNRDHVLSSFLRRLFEDERASERELINALSQGLRPAAHVIDEAMLFGSAARGEAGAGSDVDLAVVTRRPNDAVLEKTLAVLATEVKKRFGNDVSVHLSSEPVARRRKARDPSRLLWERIAEAGISVVPGPGSDAHA